MVKKNDVRIEVVKSNNNTDMVRYGTGIVQYYTISCKKKNKKIMIIRFRNNKNSKCILLFCTVYNCIKYLPYMYGIVLFLIQYRALRRTRTTNYIYRYVRCTGDKISNDIMIKLTMAAGLHHNDSIV